MRHIRKFSENVLDCIYPKDLYCICCGKIIDESRTYRLCNDCMDGIRWATGRSCRSCGKPLSSNNPGDICFNCREHAHEFERGFTCAEYGDYERRIIFALKYDGRADIAETLGEIMADRIAGDREILDYIQTCDILIPVPASRERRLKRGYNQAALICESLSARTGLRYEGEALIRIKETAKMKGLSPDERRENVRGSFGIKRNAKPLIEGSHCIIIDDIYTTGATIDEISSTLKAAGAARVGFISFASGADVVKS